MLRVVVLLLVALAPLTGRAAPVTVAFEGVVVDVTDYFSLELPVAIGDTVTGSYSYEFPDSVTAEPMCRGVSPSASCRDYEFGAQPAAGISFRVEPSGFSFSGSNAEMPSQPLAIAFIDSLSFPGSLSEDRYRVTWAREGDPFVPFVTFEELRDLVGLQIHDSVSLTVESVDEDFTLFDPLDLPDLSNATSARFGYMPRSEWVEEVFVFDDGGTATVIALRSTRVVVDLTSLRIVPEPTALALLALATAGLLARRRRDVGSV